MALNEVSEYPTAIIFLPDSVKREKWIFLGGDIEISNKTINIFVTGLFKKIHDSCLGIYSTKDYVNTAEGIIIPDIWFHLETEDNCLMLRKFKMRKEVNVKTFQIVVIYYDFTSFLQSDNSILIHSVNHINEKDYFRSLIARLKPYRKQNKLRVPTFLNGILDFIQWITLLFSLFSKKLFFITKHSSFGIYIDNYLSSLIWLLQPEGNDKRKDIKKLNFILSLITDAVLGVIFLNWLVEQFPADFSSNVLPSAEAVVQLLRNLIHWLTGDPAGFKLNLMFSKILATFYLFYIDTWCTFIAYLAAYLKTNQTMLVWFFNIIARMGFSFQVSIFADILAVVTFHIHCICLFAARLYNIQMSALISLLRLFLGRKKNPLRCRVDSFKYTPEQLFIGTLAFTILLFLLPTTLIYYVVFTLIRILLSTVKGTLSRIRYYLHSLQIYSIVLWLFKSPKVYSRVTLIPEKSEVKTNCLVFYAKLLCTSLSETIRYDIPDCIENPRDFKLLQFLYSLLLGTVY